MRFFKILSNRRLNIRVILEFKFFLPILILRKKIFSFFDRRYDRENIMVNIGSAYFFERHWKALDYSTPSYPYPPNTLDYNFSLMSEEPFPFEDNSVTYFYSSHTLEHIPQSFCPHIFSEMFRCLKPGGAIRLTMPDFDYFYNAYRNGNLKLFSKHGAGFDNMEEGLISVFAWAVSGNVSSEDVKKNFAKMSRESFANHYIKLLPAENQETAASHHKNWWNFDKLNQMAISAGFTDTYKSSPQESRFRAMRGNFSFFGLNKLFPGNRMLGFDNAHPESSVFFEAVK